MRVRCAVGVFDRAYHPVVVRSPRAREGRGFRGLGTTVDVTGIANGDLACCVTSLRGRVFASGLMIAEVRDVGCSSALQGLEISGRAAALLSESTCSGSHKKHVTGPLNDAMFVLTRWRKPY